MAPWLFVCLAWPSEASNLILWERRGTWRRRLSLCLVGVAFVALGWLWWHAWFPFVATALCVAIWKHPPPFCLAGMWGWVNIPRVYIISPSGFMDSLAYSMLYKYSYLNHEYISIEHYRTNNQIKYPFNHSLYTTYGVYIYIYTHAHIYIYIFIYLGLNPSRTKLATWGIPHLNKNSWKWLCFIRSLQTCFMSRLSVGFMVDRCN